MNEHLFCKYFVRLSVGIVTKALLLMDVVILVIFWVIDILFTGAFILYGFGNQIPRNRERYTEDKS